MGVWWHALAFVTHERAKMSHKPGRNVTQAGPKCHTRAKMSHSHVIIADTPPLLLHYDDVIMDAIASQITSLTIVYSIVYSDADQRKHQSSASLAFVRGIHRGPVNSPHKWPVTRKMFPFDDVIMAWGMYNRCNHLSFLHWIKPALRL